MHPVSPKNSALQFQYFVHLPFQRKYKNITLTLGFLISINIILH